MEIMLGQDHRAPSLTSSSESVAASVLALQVEFDELRTDQPPFGRKAGASPDNWK